MQTKVSLTYSRTQSKIMSCIQQPKTLKDANYNTTRIFCQNPIKVIKKQKVKHDV